jgi:hypothetical protein
MIRERGEGGPGLRLTAPTVPSGLWAPPRFGQSS